MRCLDCANNKRQSRAGDLDDCLSQYVAARRGDKIEFFCRHQIGKVTKQKTPEQWTVWPFCSGVLDALKILRHVHRDSRRTFQHFNPIAL